jgi:hypothetical protein
MNPELSLSPRRPTLLRRMLSLKSGFLSRFFARRSPGNFDDEGGSYEDPDVILSPSNTVPAPPQPLVCDDCDDSFVVYSVVVNRVADCNFFAKLQSLADAIKKAADYFKDQFECDDEDCPQKVGEIIWIGMSCSKNPTAVFAAVEVRFKCEIEL